MSRRPDWGCALKRMLWFAGWQVPVFHSRQCKTCDRTMDVSSNAKAFNSVCGVCRGIATHPGDTTAQRPRWVKLLSMLRHSSDAGVGDTAQRIVAKFGGERYKRFTERLGMPCGCSDRQAEWNKLYPYS